MPVEKKLIDYYEKFTIPKTATQESLTRYLRKLSVKYHPDSNPDPDLQAWADKEMRLLNEAREILLDPIKRKNYDQQLMLQEKQQTPNPQTHQPTPKPPPKEQETKEWIGKCPKCHTNALFLGRYQNMCLTCKMAFPNPLSDTFPEQFLKEYIIIQKHITNNSPTSLEHDYIWETQCPNCNGKRWFHQDDYWKCPCGETLWIQHTKIWERKWAREGKTPPNSQTTTPEKPKRKIHGKIFALIAFLTFAIPNFMAIAAYAPPTPLEGQSPSNWNKASQIAQKMPYGKKIHNHQSSIEAREELAKLSKNDITNEFLLAEAALLIFIGILYGCYKTIIFFFTNKKKTIWSKIIKWFIFAFLLVMIIPLLLTALLPFVDKAMANLIVSILPPLILLILLVRWLTKKYSSKKILTGGAFSILSMLLGAVLLGRFINKNNR